MGGGTQKSPKGTLVVIALNEDGLRTYEDRDGGLKRTFRGPVPVQAYLNTLVDSGDEVRIYYTEDASGRRELEGIGTMVDGLGKLERGILSEEAIVIGHRYEILKPKTE